MKKLASIAMLLMYTALVCGCALQVHYCGDELADASLTMFASAPECDCGEMADGCCQNFVIEVKLKTEHKNPPFLNRLKNISVFQTVIYFPQKHFVLHYISSSPITDYHSPPPKPGEEALKMNCILRI